MNTHIYATLEFDRIIDYLAGLAISPLGKKIALQIEPHNDLSFVEKKLSEVTELREILDFDDPFPLYGLIDITPSLKKSQIHGNYLPPEELANIVQTLQVSRRIHAYFIERKEKYPALGRVIKHIESFQSIEKQIMRCIDVATNEILDRASPELNRIRRAIETHELKIRKKLEDMVASFSRQNYLQENLIAVRDGRLVLMVKDAYKTKVKGLVHDQSATGATLFVEPLESLELNNQVRALKLNERREIEKILTRLTDLIRENLSAIETSLDALAQLDFIYAKAVFSQKISGGQPAINQNDRLELIKGKHPLLILRDDPAKQVVPLDLKMGKNYKTLIISGPNAGGKTVALKTVGLICLMTACGMHIPADPSSNIPVFDAIFSSIGDQQSIENDLSTFSSHVAKLTEIVDHVTANNLVLIDEIGSGTDPDEGASLAISVLEYLKDIGCLTIVSTHQGALKVFAHETPGVENGSMEFDRETLQPTYYFRLGIPGSSYAYEIAKRWGLKEVITARARELTGSQKTQVEKLLMDLDNKMKKYRALSQQLEDKDKKLDELISSYQHKNTELVKRERDFKKNAIAEAEQILQDANRAVEQSIKAIKEQHANREAIKQAHDLIEQEKRKVQANKKKISRIIKEDSPMKPLESAHIGQDVFWSTYQSFGTVLSEEDSAGRVLIQTGDVKIRVPLNELSIASKSRQKSRTASATRIQMNFDRLTSDEIDIRGYRVDEALSAVDKFIDEAILSGLKKIYIIHGKGTGALRKAIHHFLQNHKKVKNRGHAEWNLGDTGMTVVELD